MTVSEAIEVPAGLRGVVVTSTQIGDVRGRQGYYHYREYSAIELARTQSFEDVWFLFTEGHLPTPAERADFAARLAPLRTVPAELWDALPAIAAAGERFNPLAGLDEIGSPERIDQWVRAKVSANDRIMGFGHSVYRTEDPRSVLLREAAEELGGDLVDFAVAVERKVVELLAELKPGRELYANVEFYAGVVMELCGIPRAMFTPTFAVSRVIGWCANILEQAAEATVIRPAARYTGPLPPA